MCSRDEIGVVKLHEAVKQISALAMAHCNAQAVEDIPRGLVGHAELCHQLDCRAAALIDREQIHRPEPKIELDVRPVEHCTAGRGDLFVAGLAAVRPASPDPADLASAAVRADKSVREAQPEEQLAADLLGAVTCRKIDDAEFSLWEH